MAPPLLGVSVSVARTRNCATDESAVGLPVTVIVKPGGGTPPAVAATVKVQPAAMLPPETAHVKGEGANRPLGFEIETDASAVLKPDPPTVTTVPTEPWDRESEIIGPPVLVNTALPLGAPKKSVKVTRYDPEAGGAATVKRPTTLPLASWLQDVGLATGVPLMVPAPGPMHGDRNPGVEVKPEPA